MKQATVDRLHALNARFYSEHAAEFSATRERPWPGVARALSLAVPAGTAVQARVLELGCGNGRALPALRGRFGAGLRYLGLDSSEPLLAIARERWGNPGVRFELADFVGAPAEQVLPEDCHELVLMLGVVHCVPSERLRRALLEAAAARVAPGGALVFTVWRYDRDPRFSARRLAPERWSALVPELDGRDLEPGDELLGFGPDPQVVRYCHFPGDAELARLTADLPLPLHARFLADGASQQLNEYLILRAAS